MINFATETSVDVLRQAGVLLETENRRLHERLRILCQELATWRGDDPNKLQLELIKLQELVNQRNHELFGDRSERRAAPGSAAEAKASSEEPRCGHGPTEQPELPVVHKVHELDPADRICPKCGGALEEMTGQSEDADEIDIVERRLVVHKHKRLKYRCTCNACVETALGPEKLIPGGRYSVNFAVNVAVDKFLDHLPWERQVGRFAREGLIVTVATLWDQCNALAQWLDPLMPKLLVYLLAKAVLGADETWWRLMDRRRNGGTTKKWWVWTLCAEDAVYYDIREKRSSEVVMDMLLGYTGTLMVDGHGAYKKGRKRGARFTLAFCWSHSRRKFMVAEQSYPREAGAILNLIDELFRIEREAARGPPGEDALLDRRRRLRDEKSRWVIAALQCWATDLEVLPQSSLGRAMRYMIDHWSGLVRFLEDPRIPLSNNHTERAERGPVVGRKNFGGCKSERGLEVAALFYSLLGSAKLAGVEPKAYLRAMAYAAIRGEELLLPHEYARQLSGKSAG
jgi:transposase